MLKPENRLRLEKEIEKVFKNGRVNTSGFFVLKLLKKEANRAKSSATRFAFVISKKISKSSVKRNRIKRQMREIVRLLFKNGLIRPNFDILIISKPAILQQKYADIREDLLSLLRRSGILKEIATPKPSAMVDGSGSQ